MEQREIKRVSKPTKLCGEPCKTHGRPCIIGMGYGDGRQEALERALFVEGVKQKFSHTKDSTHYCDICMRERREARHPGYYKYDPITQQVLPGSVITKRLKQETKKMARRKDIADGKRKAFGNRSKKKK